MKKFAKRVCLRSILSSCQRQMEESVKREERKIVAVTQQYAARIFFIAERHGIKVA